MELSADYEAEQAELKKRAAALQAELDKSQAATVNAEKFMGIVRKHLAFEELTPTLLREMMEKIVCMSAAMTRTAPAGRTLRFITALSARLTCPNNARPIRHNGQVPDRNGKIFYTSIASLSHTNKITGH